MASEVTELVDGRPPAQAARTAEQAAYAHVGLEYEEHVVPLESPRSRMRVIEVGEGPPLVLIPGGEGMSVIWLPLLPELEGFTLYLMDRPGGGLSQPVDYESIPVRDLAANSTAALFDHFDLESAPVVGNSMGGLWSLRFALAHPQRVSQLAFLGCPAVYPGTSAPLLMRIGSVGVLSGLIAGQVLLPEGTDDVRTAWDFLGHPAETVRQLPDELAEAWYRMGTLPHHRETWIGILRSVLRLRGANPTAAFTTADLENIHSPVLLIWGREDPFGSVEKGRSGARHFPDARFEEVGIGHLPWLDEPETCGRLVREFLTAQPDT